MIVRPFACRGFAALAFLALAALAIPAAAALDAPAGWRKESFPFPLAFAPSLPYQGTEQVRFSPAWSKFSGEAGFSYVALWDIRPAPLEPEALERALGVYFDGLMNNVAIGRKIEALVPQTAVVLHPLDAPAGWTEAYAGEVHTWNAFARAEDLVLNVEVAKRACGTDRVQVFFAFAKAPRSAAPWKPLREIRASASCAS
ncbi:MAG TPA: hypothetical protein VN782_16545 [Usitatibacter sp.]|nr:hypothetical protein [Usitatibacter sp.]